MTRTIVFYKLRVPPSQRYYYIVHNSSLTEYHLSDSDPHDNNITRFFFFCINTGMNELIINEGINLMNEIHNKSNGIKSIFK